jgi:hypothetical protein
LLELGKEFSNVTPVPLWAENRVEEEEGLQLQSNLPSLIFLVKGIVSRDV